MESSAKLVLTDSGGVQEETCILGVPCVTLRENTERPETLSVGSNVLVGTNPDKIGREAIKWINSQPDWKNPFGDGHTGRMIVEIIENEKLNNHYFPRIGQNQNVNDLKNT